MGQGQDGQRDRDRDGRLQLEYKPLKKGTFRVKASIVAKTGGLQGLDDGEQDVQGEVKPLSGRGGRTGEDAEGGRSLGPPALGVSGAPRRRRGA